MAKNNRRNNSFDPTLGLEDTIQTISKKSSSVLSTEGAKLDPVMSKAVKDILTDSEENYAYYLGEAKVLATEAWAIGNGAEEDIQNRNRDIRNARAIAKATGREDWEIWRSMEDMEDVKDFGKRIWEKIKAAIKKLILMVINLIKSIGNFIKGAACKAQEFFYKKYASKVIKEANAGIKSQYVAGVEKESTKSVKMKSVSATQCFKDGGRPDIVLGELCAGISAMAAIVVTTGEGIASGNVDSSKFRRMGEIYLKYAKNDAEGKKIVEQEGKWFPSAAKVINTMCYGQDKPTKNSINAAIVINQCLDLLSPGALQKLQYAFKTGQTLNKMLEKQIVMITKIEKAEDYGYSSRGSDERTDAKKNNTKRSDLVMRLRRASHFMSTLLLQAYGEALTARWKVFVAAKKYVKGGEKEEKQAEREKKKAEQENK